MLSKEQLHVAREVMVYGSIAYFTGICDTKSALAYAIAVPLIGSLALRMKINPLISGAVAFSGGVITGKAFSEMSVGSVLSLECVRILLYVGMTCCEARNLNIDVTPYTAAWKVWVARRAR